MSEKIRSYLASKTKELNAHIDTWENKREKEAAEIQNEFNEIQNKKTDDDNKLEDQTRQVQLVMQENDQREKEEEEKKALAEKKRLEKIAQEDAARFIQRKWQWYKVEGKALGKRRKKGKKGKKKK